MGKYRYFYDVFREIVPNRKMTEAREDFAGLRQFLLGKPVVVPVPLSRQRFSERGFNQAAIIASEAGHNLGLEVHEMLFRKEDKSGHQVGKSREDRLRLVAGTFFVKQGSNCENVLIVDDVWTTGATLREAARTLKKSGVKKVWGFVLGR
jgi:ComF family protein